MYCEPSLTLRRGPSTEEEKAAAAEYHPLKRDLDMSGLTGLSPR